MRIPPPRLAARHTATALVWLLAAAAALTAAGIYITRGSFVLGRITSGDYLQHTDWETFWRSAVALRDGHDIYLDTGASLVNLNAPIWTALLSWTAPAGFWPAYRTWLLISVILIVVSMALVAADLRLRPAVAVAFGGVTVVSTPVLATLGLGQIYPVLMVGIAAAWVFEHRARPVLAGIALGVTVALKPSLAPLLLVPLMRRRWDTLAAAIAAGGITTIAGWVATGPGSLPTWVQVVTTYPLNTFFDNASLPATITRLTSNTEWGRPVVEIPGGEWIGYGIGAVLVGVTAWLVRRPPAVGPDSAVWAMTAASLLLSPIAWHTYLMILAPGVLVLAAAGRPAVVALLATLALIPMDWMGLWYGEDGTTLPSAVPVSLYCGILIVYWAALVPWRGRRVGRGIGSDRLSVGEKGALQLAAGTAGRSVIMAAAPTGSR